MTGLCWQLFWAIWSKSKFLIMFNIPLWEWLVAGNVYIVTWTVVNLSIRIINQLRDQRQISIRMQRLAFLNSDHDRAAVPPLTLQHICPRSHHAAVFASYWWMWYDMDLLPATTWISTRKIHQRLRNIPHGSRCSTVWWSVSKRTSVFSVAQISSNFRQTYPKDQEFWSVATHAVPVCDKWSSSKSMP